MLLLVFHIRNFRERKRSMTMSGDLDLDNRSDSDNISDYMHKSGPGALIQLEKRT